MALKQSCKSPDLPSLQADRQRAAHPDAARVRRQTLDWLRRHPVRWDLLIMRDEDDWSSSHTFKRIELGELQRSGFECRLAIDDDPRNVEMYRKAGVPALYFHSGYYD